MSITLRGLTSEWYTPDSQKGEDEPARFKLRPLTAPEMAEVSLHFEKGAGVRAPGLIKAAKFGTQDWENVKNTDGKPLRVTPNNVERLDFELLCEIGAEVVNLNSMEDDETKNS